MRGIVWILAGMAFAGFASGCQSNSEFYGTPTSEARAAPERGDDGPALAVTTYQLGTGDRLNVLVFNHPNLSAQNIAVDAEGQVSVPLLGSIRALDLTSAQLAREIEANLQRQGLLRNPQVNVEIVEFRPFTILGEVNSPDRYPFEVGLTVVEAVARAGGYTYRANERRVFIQRDGESKERLIQVTGTTPVFPGDRIRVPDRRL